MSTHTSTPDGMYGHRARIGYTCPPLSAEIFPYEFYKLAPAGVTLVITTLTVIERSKSEVDQAYDMSMRAARELAAAGVDLVFLGGVPVNLSRGDQNAQSMLQTLAAELGVKVSSSVAAQEKAARMLACKNVVIAHPYGAREDARLISFLPSPHWPVIEAIDPLEREFGVSVMAASQACVWDALRLAGVNDRIEGYGRLLREF